MRENYGSVPGRLDVMGLLAAPTSRYLSEATYRQMLFNVL